ncbi:MAG: hypothetical protein AB7W47_10405 [Calditrichaceae bacterium]
MRKFIFVLLSLLTLGFLASCGGGKKMAAVSEGYEVLEDPFQDLRTLSNDIIQAGGVAALAQGISERRDLAEKKAVTEAKAQLASIFEEQVQQLNKKFQEEIGSNDDTEINEAFTSVIKTRSSQMLRGAITKKVKYMKKKDSDVITCAAVVAIEPNNVNLSILDELKKNDNKLYERFRASQAYEELKKEMEEYEKQQNN